MTAQELADRLAELAGWKYGSMTDPAIKGLARGWSKGTNLLLYGQHPYPVGSLDALEAFRREQLLGWEWDCVRWYGPDNCHAKVREKGCPPNRHPATWPGDGPDEWTARASALIAAKETEHG